MLPPQLQGELLGFVFADLRVCVPHAGSRGEVPKLEFFLLKLELLFLKLELLLLKLNIFNHPLTLPVVVINNQSSRGPRKLIDGIVRGCIGFNLHDEGLVAGNVPLDDIGRLAAIVLGAVARQPVDELEGSFKLDDVLDLFAWT